MELREGALLRCSAASSAAFLSTTPAVAVASGSRVSIFDTVNGAQVARLEAGRRVTHLAACAAPDAAALTAMCEDGRVIVWRESDFTVAASFVPSKSDQRVPCTAAACSPTKPLLFYGREGRPAIYALHLLGEKPPFKMDEGRKNVTALACHPRRALLVAGYGDGAIRLWDHGGQAPVMKYAIESEATRGAILSLVFHPLREVVAAVHADGATTVWTLGIDAPTAMGVFNPPTRSICGAFVSGDALLSARVAGVVSTATFTGAPGHPFQDDGIAISVPGGVTGLAVSHSGSTALALGPAPRLLHLCTRLHPALPAVAAPWGKLPMVDPGRAVWASADGVLACAPGGATDKLCPVPSAAAMPPSLLRASADGTQFLVFYPDGRYARTAPDIEKPALAEGRDGVFCGPGGRYVLLSASGAELALLDGKGGVASKAALDPPASRVFATPLRDGTTVALFSAAGARLWLWATGGGTGPAAPAGEEQALRLPPREDVLDVVWRTGDTPMAAVITTARIVITDAAFKPLSAAVLPASGGVVAPSALWFGETLLFTSAGSLCGMSPDGAVTRLASTPHPIAAIACVTISGVVLAARSPGSPHTLALHSRAVGWLQPAALAILGRPHTNAELAAALRRWDGVRITSRLIRALTKDHPAAALQLVLRLPAVRFPLAVRVAAALAAKRPNDAANFVLGAAELAPLPAYARQLAGEVARACARMKLWASARTLHELAGNKLAALRCVGDDEPFDASAAESESIDLCSDPVPSDLQQWLGSDAVPGAATRRKPGDEPAPAADLRTVDEEGFMEQPDLAREYISGMGGLNDSDSDDGKPAKPAKAAAGTGGAGGAGFTVSVGQQIDGDAPKGEGEGPGAASPAAQKDESEEEDSAAALRRRKLRFVIKEKGAARPRGGASALTRAAAALTLGPLPGPDDVGAPSAPVTPTALGLGPPPGDTPAAAAAAPAQATGGARPRPAFQLEGPPEPGLSSAAGGTAPGPAAAAAAAGVASGAGPAGGPKPSLVSPPVPVGRPGADAQGQAAAAAMARGDAAAAAMAKCVSLLERGEFAAAHAAVQAALAALAAEGGRRAGAVRTASAYDTALRLLLAMRAPGVAPEAAALYARMLVTLPLAPPHRATCLGIAARKNAEAKNWATAGRFFRQLLAQAPPAKQEELSKRAAQCEGNGPDQGMPPFVCPACDASTEAGQLTCTHCRAPIRFCYTTLHLLSSKQYLSCPLCAADVSEGDGRTAGAKCSVCSIGVLTSATATRPA